MRLLVSSIAILTLPVVTVARTGQAPGETKTHQSDSELLVQMEKDLFQAKMTTNPDVIVSVNLIWPLLIFSFGPTLLVNRLP
jgi:hypothetical protein